MERVQRAYELASSPHTRGSSRRSWRCRHAARVVPAHAGVIPVPHDDCVLQSGRPRTRGGHPSIRRGSGRLTSSSPHTRGSSREGGKMSVVMQVVPAHAGVIPMNRLTRQDRDSRPRTRGGHPLDQCSAGWTVIVVPAHAGVIPAAKRLCPSSAGRPRTRGGHPMAEISGDDTMESSPHTRGSSPKSQKGKRYVPVVPAHAGVIPRRLL